MGSLPQIVVLARKTGLSKRTVKNLLRKGWVYHDSTRHVPYWEHPMANIKE